MKPGWVAALAVAVALVAAEIVHPTTVPPKQLSHPRPDPSGRFALTPEQLDDLPPIDRLAMGNIDALHAIVGGRERNLVSDERLAGTDLFELTGWCADPEARAPGAGLIAIVDGTGRIDVSGNYGSERDDVARAFGSAAMGRVGFDIRLPSRQLGPGAHAIRVAVIARDGRGIFIFPTIARIAVAR